MSGGSFCYLYAKDAVELFETPELLGEMKDALDELGYASGASAETQAIIDEIEAFKASVNARIANLSEVWKAVEWWHSADWGQDDVVEAVDKFNARKTPKTWRSPLVIWCAARSLRGWVVKVEELIGEEWTVKYYAPPPSHYHTGSGISGEEAFALIAATVAWQHATLAVD